MYPKLPSVEVYSYFVTWILGVSYAVYHVYLLGHEFDFSQLDTSVPGWSFLDRRKDSSDFEWTSWLTFIPVLLPWILVQIFVSEILRWKYSDSLPVFYFIFSAVFMNFFLGPGITVFMIFQPCIIYISALVGYRSIVWIVSLISLFVFCNSEFGMDLFNAVDGIRYLAFVSMAWNNLRAISYCLDNLREVHSRSLLALLAYCFYLPTLFFGPLILYEEFDCGLKRQFKRWTLRRCMYILLDLFRFFGWAIIADLSLHYFHFCTIQTMPAFVLELRPWALYGMGYCMGQFFMVKYTVLYGVPATFARAEHIEAPHHPKCIARIHLYSNMWRYFDQGLYHFLSKYIYVPCLGTSPHLFRKLLASALCFIFVYVWHGLYLHILIWTVLNFVGVSVEGICKVLGTSLVYQEWEKRHLSKENCRRFKALISIPIFIMSAISNFYFFAGYAIGNIYVNRLLSGSLLANSTLFFFCYCCCQVSIEVSNWEQQKKVKSWKYE